MQIAHQSLNEIFKQDDPTLQQRLQDALKEVDARIMEQLATEVEKIKPHRPQDRIQFAGPQHVQELNEIVEEINKTAEKLQYLIDYETAYCLVQDQLCGFIQQTQQNMQARERLRQAVMQGEEKDVAAILLRLVQL